MIVGEPNPLAGGVHDRMPVMLIPEEYGTWLGPSKSAEELRALTRPYDASLMEAYARTREQRASVGSLLSRIRQEVDSGKTIFRHAKDAIELKFSPLGWQRRVGVGRRGEE